MEKRREWLGWDKDKPHTHTGEKFPNTQTRKYTNTQIHKYTNMRYERGEERRKLG